MDTSDWRSETIGEHVAEVRACSWTLGQRAEEAPAALRQERSEKAAPERKPVKKMAGEKERARKRRKLRKKLTSRKKGLTNEGAGKKSFEKKAPKKKALKKKALKKKAADWTRQVTRCPGATSEPGRQHEGPVLFIVDARNRLERRLLEDCLGKFKETDSATGSPERVFLPISKETHTPGMGGLAQKLDAPEKPCWCRFGSPG